MSKSLPMPFLLSGFSTITIPRFRQFRPCPRSALFLFQKKSDPWNSNLLPPFSFQHISIPPNLEFSHVHDLGFLARVFKKSVTNLPQCQDFLPYRSFSLVSTQSPSPSFLNCRHDPAFFPKGFKQVCNQSSMAGFLTISFLPSSFNPISPDFLNSRHVHDPAFLSPVFRQVSGQIPLPIFTMSLPSLKSQQSPPPVLRKFASTGSHSRKRERATSF